MFLPLGDSPNPARAQWVTRILVAVNVAIFLLVSLPLQRPLEPEDMGDPEVASIVMAMHDAGLPGPETRYDLFVWKHGYRPAEGTLMALLTCMFLHAGWVHLLGNMLYLWIFGDNVEARLGGIPFLGAYLATGAVATLAFATLKSESMIPMVGASGAISGVIGFYLVWFPRNQIRVLLFLFYFIDMIYVPAIFVLGFYIVVDNILPFFMSRGEGGGVAYGAHLGGVFAGMIAAFALDRIRGRVPAPRPAARPPERMRWGSGGLRPAQARVTHDWTREFHEHLSARRMRDAVDAFAHLATEGATPPDPLETFELADWLYSENYPHDAASVFRYYIRHYPTGSDLGRVNLGLGLLLSRKLGQRTAAREHLLLAIELSGGDARVAETAQRELELIDRR